MNSTLMSKDDWLEIDTTVTRIARPAIKKAFARIDRRLRKKWRRYQLQKKKQ